MNTRKIRITPEHVGMTVGEMIARTEPDIKTRWPVDPEANDMTRRCFEREASLAFRQGNLNLAIELQQLANECEVMIVQQRAAQFKINCWKHIQEINLACEKKSKVEACCNSIPL